MKKNIWAVSGSVLGVLALTLIVGCNRMTSITAAVTNPVSNTAAVTYTPPQADNMLSCNLYNFYQGQSGNIFFSPFSIITCLAMAQEGAVGNTQTQMQTVLNLNPNTTTRLQGFQQLITEINAPSKPYTLATADDMWPQQNFTILPAFTNTLQTYYAAGVTALDYINNSNGAMVTINGAVSQQTDGFIPNLLSPGSLTNKTRLVLTNAIYFKADWASQFTTMGTSPQNFTLPSGTTESVSMMHQSLTAAVGTYNGAASVLAMPYKLGGASMYIFLPPAGGMANLETQMTGADINAWLSANAAGMTAINGPTIHSVTLSLPKFTFSTSYDLSSTLASMGMPLAFAKPGSSGANFSGIDGNLDLSISNVIHMAYIDVNETGTTAAAATAVIIGITMGMTMPINPVTFTVDHPFIFMIVDNASNTVLFMGRVNDPLSTS